MTTVVWDGTTLAADGRSTAGASIISDKTIKIHKLNGTMRGEKLLAFGYAGDAYELDLFKAWIEEGGDYPEHVGVDLLVVTDKHVYQNFPSGEDGPMVLLAQNSDVSTLGSGSSFAESALLLGMNAVDAVKHACKLDIYSGGKITKMRLR